MNSSSVPVGSVVTPERLAKYFSVTEKALEMASKNVSPKEKARADVILDMVSRYVSDAHHFGKKGDVVTAFAALNYAHGWLDCGATLKIFNVKDSTLFTVDD